MVGNVKSTHKFLMYPRFLQMGLNIETASKIPYHIVPLREKIFGNMKSGFEGVDMPLSVALLPASSNINAGTAKAQFAPVHTLELSSSASLPLPHEEPLTMNVDDLLQSVPSLLTRINGLEQELTKTNKKVKKLEQIVQNL